jgi:hypothetical protein
MSSTFAVPNDSRKGRRRNGNDAADRRWSCASTGDLARRPVSCGRSWRPERSPHKLAAAIVSTEGLCKECCERLTGQYVKIESDDNRRSIRHMK